MSGILEILNEIDGQILLAVNSCHAPFWDEFMYGFSGRVIWVGLYVAIFAALVWRFGWQRALAYGVGAGLVVLFADQICASVIRPFCERLRPSNLDNPLSQYVHIVNGKRGGAFGFPSCHAANTVGAAVYMSLIFRRRRFVIFIALWAFVTCWSRMYLGVHYLGDLFVGAIVGTVGGLLSYWLTSKFIARYMKKTPVAEPAGVCKSGRSILSGRFVPSDVAVAVGLLTVLFLLVKSACITWL